MENNVSWMTSFLLAGHTFGASPQSLHRPSHCVNVFGGGLLFMTDPVVLNASTHRSIVFRSGIAPRHSTLNFRRKRQRVTMESLFLKNCSTANTWWSTFQCAMATETGSHPMSSTPPLPNTSHLKNMHFLCSTLYYHKNMHDVMLKKKTPSNNHDTKV